MNTILCDELLQEIFHRLPPPSSAAVSLVSRRWRRLLRSSLSTLTLRLSHHHPSFPSFLSDHTYLSSLSITTTTAAVSDHLLISISGNCPNLTQLNLWSGPVSIQPLLSLSTSCLILSSLSIILSRPLFSLEFLSSFSNLKTLTLTLVGNTNTSISDQFVSSSAQLKLQSISLSGIRPGGDYAINFLWNNCCYDTLSKLAFDNCEAVGDNYSFSTFIKGLTNLQELQLKTCRSITALILLNLTDNPYHTLSSLLIYDGANKESLLNFVRHSNCNLRTLDLRLPLDLDDTHLLEIGTKFSQLNVLRLQSCCMVTREALRTLGLALTSLEELGLTNCDVINGQTGFLVELAQSLPNIKTLDLSYNHTLIDKEFASIISSFCNLRKLKLRGCSRLTKVSLIALCKKCKRLESVDVLYCNGIQVEGVEFVMLNLPELRNLRVEDRKVSEAARRWMTHRFIEVQS